MKKFKILIPTVVLFVSPWMHWLIYHNLLAAWPEMDHAGAHIFGLFGAVLAFGATAILISY